MKFLIACTAAVALLSGCANLTSPARSSQLDDKKAYWFDYDASRRGAILVSSDSKFKSCSEPSPDVALTLVTKLEASLKKDGVEEAKGNAEFNASVVKLAERTQMVMFLREALFRLCEQSLNQNFTKDEVLAAYKNVIDGAIEIVKTDGKKADAEKAKAEAMKNLTEKGAAPDEIRKMIKP
jgi:hypothetical protein